MCKKRGSETSGSDQSWSTLPKHINYQTSLLLPTITALSLKFWSLKQYFDQQPTIMFWIFSGLMRLGCQVDCSIINQCLYQAVFVVKLILLTKRNFSISINWWQVTYIYDSIVILIFYFDQRIENGPFWQNATYC